MKQRDYEVLTLHTMIVEYSFLLLQWVFLFSSIFSFYVSGWFYGIVFFVASWLSFKLRKLQKAALQSEIDAYDLKIRSLYARLGRRGRRKIQRMKSKK